MLSTNSTVLDLRFRTVLLEQETLVNVGGRTRSGGFRERSRGGPDELIVVTILVAADGGLKLPSVRSREELRTALNRLGALRAEQVGGTCRMQTLHSTKFSTTQQFIVSMTAAQACSS